MIIREFWLNLDFSLPRIMILSLSLMWLHETKIIICINVKRLFYFPPNVTWTPHTQPRSQALSSSTTRAWNRGCLTPTLHIIKTHSYVNTVVRNLFSSHLSGRFWFYLTNKFNQTNLKTNMSHQSLGQRLTSPISASGGNRNILFISALNKVKSKIKNHLLEIVASVG